MNSNWLCNVLLAKGSEDLFVQPYVQPQVSFGSRKITGVEVLGRIMNRITGNCISPCDFMPLMRKYDLGYMFTLQLIEKTISDFALCNMYDIPISINIDNCLIENTRFIEHLIQLLTSQNVFSMNLITVEITEHEYCRSPSKASAIKLIKHHGMKVSLDDFGTGYSTFEELLSFGYDEVKIDREIITNFNRKPMFKKLLEQLDCITKNTNIKVVAEGIENEQLISSIKSFNVDMLQGFYFHKPMPIKSFSNVYLDQMYSS
ncbi:EAL domain-containing protein [Vibrio sp. YMD68]|uniref:EAL domain-containing protein n=1 Tax=Vibrio sp. YMD68 TaxID=3042300 RepID=UPI00249AB1A8|nr:EAL domain-containing protein [Vibrio sp. YMD68]WGW01361.1 EAL domain-containing protein [Vibrio sp. YMD68]